MTSHLADLWTVVAAFRWHLLFVVVAGVLVIAAVGHRTDPGRRSR